MYSSRTKGVMEHLTPNSSSRNLHYAVAVHFSQCMLQRQSNEGTDNKGTTSLVPKQASKLPVTHVSYMTHYVSPLYLRNSTTASIVCCIHVYRTLSVEMHKRKGFWCKHPAILYLQTSESTRMRHEPVS